VVFTALLLQVTVFLDMTALIAGVSEELGVSIVSYYSL
jgi:hypothetical protein